MESAPARPFSQLPVLMKLSIRSGSVAALLIFFAPALRAYIKLSPGLTYAEEGGTLIPSKDHALAVNGGVASAKDVFLSGQEPAHQISHLNDGRYGNDYSWIGNSAPSWAVISFGSTARTIASFAIGRANADPQY